MLDTARDLDLHHPRRHSAGGWIARTLGGTDEPALTRHDVEALLGAGDTVKLRSGAVLHREGEPVPAAHVLRSGRIELYRRGRSGDRVVGQVGPGGVVGDVSLFRGGSAMSSARVADDAVALRIDRHRVVALLLGHPRIAVRWLMAGLDELEAARRVVRMLHGTVKEQLAELLVAEAGYSGDVSLSQAAIAAILGASRQSINEALADLRRSGLVATGYRTVQVLDAARLRHLAYPEADHTE